MTRTAGQSRSLTIVALLGATCALCVGGVAGLALCLVGATLRVVYKCLPSEHQQTRHTEAYGTSQVAGGYLMVHQNSPQASLSTGQIGAQVNGDPQFVVHWVGPVLCVNGHQRQRCMWCGASVIDRDVDRSQIPNGDSVAGMPGTTIPGTWEIGSMIAVTADGHSQWCEQTNDQQSEDINPPEQSCMVLDPAVTQ